MQKGFSSDGFITDQDYFGDYPYRAMTSDINGCGWMAATCLMWCLCWRKVPCSWIRAGCSSA